MSQKKSCPGSFFYLIRKLSSTAVTKLRAVLVLMLLTLRALTLILPMLKRAAHVRSNQARGYCNY
jgi:hypothetical protein